MKFRIVAPAVCVLASITLAEPLPAFFQSLFQKHQRQILQKFSGQCSQICGKLDIDKSDTSAISAVNSLLFLHALFTATDATDCTRGGILKTVYLWHWTDPNPRHFLLHLPDSAKLVAMKPPKGFEKYKSLADIDRLPCIYLGDAVSSAPSYYHPLCGEMFTFGWCSEREMAFNALLQILGFDCKIKQEGIHVWSEVLLKTARHDEPGTLLVISLDNTFNAVGCGKMRIKHQTWKDDVGKGGQVKWYNAVAHSAKQEGLVKNIEVSEPARLRIER
ncbi:MAG TPA: hypothetical protein VLX68_09630 [Chitinivibrionales bacterium]|nr:hypothetical protein [Chitinivibrionales bacterium]